METYENDLSALELGGKKEELSIFFSDMAGFSSFSEKLDPAFLVEILNKYFSKMTEILLENGGTLDKYEGDAIMAFFGAPLKNPGHAEDAPRVALLMQKALPELKAQW